MGISYDIVLCAHQLIFPSTAGSIILSIAYGLDVQPKDDPFIEYAEKASISLRKVPYVGAYLVDHFEFLKHIPAWLPGAKFKRDAKEWRQITSDMINKPFDVVKAKMVCSKQY